jgi:hypothetical protein
MTHRCQQLSCDHSQVKFCPHCQNCYCERCGKKWSETKPVWEPGYIGTTPGEPGTFTYNTGSGETLTFKRADMQKREVICEHHA